jgi:hypothetical protein
MLERAFALVSCGLLAAVAGCSENDPANPAANDPGSSLMAEAYAALKSADYAATPDLIAGLDAAFEAKPDQGRLAFYAGTMRLWRATGGPREPVEQLDDVLGAIAKLEQARALRPEDAHVGAFLGIAHVALGDVLSDEARIDTGHQVLTQSVRLYPPYVNGVMTQAMGLLPRDHRYFPEAIEAMNATLAACKVEAASGELRIAYPSAADVPFGTCWNGGIVDHVWEGIFLIYGDVLVKTGDAERGKLLYAVAKQSPTYERWLFASELEARIASAGERAALYLDGDRSNDPPTWMDDRGLCVGCHASKP